MLAGLGAVRREVVEDQDPARSTFEESRVFL